jgi:hypothetical protein
MEKIWIEGQGSGLEKFGSRIWYLEWKKFGSGIQDPGSTSRISKNGNLVA